MHCGLVVKEQIRGQRSYEYLPTQACRELEDIVIAMGKWGRRWTKDLLCESDYDVHLLMLYLQRSIVPEKLHAAETVVQFHFNDLQQSMQNWWICARADQCEVCSIDPKKKVDVQFSCNIQEMVRLWMAEYSYADAIRRGRFKVHGSAQLKKNIASWLRPAPFADMPVASAIRNES